MSTPDQSSTDESSPNDDGVGRFEYRVWGKQRDARKRLTKLAEIEKRERIKDCYLLVDDLSWNAKIRDNTLKIKRLIEEDHGFERWSSGKHRSADSTPSPFDILFDELRLDRPQRGKRYDLYGAIAKLDPDLGVRAVFVVKDRRLYRIGGLRAEATDIEVKETKQTLYTLSIEGDDLDELVGLRDRLGLDDVPNVAIHEMIGRDD